MARQGPGRRPITPFVVLLLLVGCNPTPESSNPPASSAPASTAPASSLPASSLPESAAPASSLPASATPAADVFTYDPPGKLQAGNTGVIDTKIYAPGIRFPIEHPKAFPESQLWAHGGIQGPPGTDQCDPVNFVYPWHDDFCEPRDYATSLCPSGHGHQGQDIRASSCQAGIWPAVAVESGTITQITGWKVYLYSPTSHLTYIYMHMKPATLKVHVNQVVTRGQEMGFVSNYFPPGGTTVHLHFEILQPVSDGAHAYTNVPPYTSLVDAYQRLLSGADH